MKVFPGVNIFIRWVFNFCLFLSWYYRAKCLILGGGVEDGMIFIARTVICDEYSSILVSMPQLLPRFLLFLPFKRCVTNVRSAGRPHSLYSKSLFFSRSPLLLLLSYFLVYLGRTAAGCTPVENHGGGGL